ncbi:hypothetical protein EIP86_008930, partial [Pleurotus ostreatoroseus]
MPSGRYKSDREVNCHVCGKRYNAKGIASHLRTHDRKAREQAIDEAAALNVAEEAAAPLPEFPTLGPWVEYQWDPAAELSVEHAFEPDPDPEDSDYEDALQPLTYDDFTRERAAAHCVPTLV